MIEGIDVSNNQGNVDWAKVASSVKFAHAKATEGLTYVDPDYARNRVGAGRVGLHFGAYHFARPDLHASVNGAVAEATHFCAVIGKPKPGDLRPVLDLEEGTGNLTAWAGAFLSEVEKRTSVRPLLYTYPGFVSHLNLKALAGYGLWLADYGPNDGREHPASLKNVEHQFTSRGRVSGVLGNVDVNSAPSLDPIIVPAPAVAVSVDPRPEAKNDMPFTRKLWPVPVPAWFWAWAQWRQHGKFGLRPADAPARIPAWAWIRLAAL